MQTTSRGAQTLALLEPGRWYAAAVVDQLAGRKRALFDLSKPHKDGCLDRARNPKFNGHVFCFAQKEKSRGLNVEPEILFRLNAKGEALRLAVLENRGVAVFLE